MNTLLENLFEKYNFSDKQRYEIRQFYSFLPTDKKVNLINNFDVFATKMQQIQDELEQEKSILLDNAVNKVEQALIQKRKENLAADTKKSIQALKQ